MVLMGEEEDSTKANNAHTIAITNNNVTIFCFFNLKNNKDGSKILGLTKEKV